MNKKAAEITVLNFQKKKRIDLKEIKGFALNICEGLRKSGELNIVFVDNKKIKVLNRKYRHKNRITDVLSFSEKINLPLSRFQFPIMGDIVISAERAEKQAEKYGHAFKDEIRLLAAHGILHLAGFTHAEMKKISREKGIKSLRLQ